MKLWVQQTVLVLACATAVFVPSEVAAGRVGRSSSASSFGEQATRRGGSAAKHVKLDVGLRDYEENVTKALLAGPLNQQNLSALKGFNDAERKELVNHTLTRLDQSFVVAVAPLKKAIGKSWMGCPDDGKDSFITSLKGSFSNIYARALVSFPRNGGFMMRALQEYPPKGLSLKHAEDTIFNSLNKTLYRSVSNLEGYVDLDAKSVTFMSRMGGLSLIEVI